MKHRFSFSARQWRQQPTERLTNRLLYIMVGVAAVVFVAFWTIGFDMPSLESPGMNAPLLTSLLLWTVYIFVVAAVVALVWAAVRSARQQKGQSHTVNGINSWRLSAGVACGTVALLIITFLLGSTDALRVNGKEYTSWLWLKVSDMFVWSSLLLTVAAIGAAIFGATRYVRKRKEA